MAYRLRGSSVRSVPPAAVVALVVAAILAWLAWAGRPAAAAPMSRPGFDEAITRELAAMSPEAAPLFAEANAARDRDDLATAADRYAKVVALAPSFDHALRRLCGTESQLDKHSAAIAHCREALALKESADNHSGLAHALAYGASASRANVTELNEARTHAERAWQMEPSDPSIVEATCAVGLAREDLSSVRKCVKALQSIAPDESATHAQAAVLALIDGDVPVARAELEKAKAAGLPSASYASFEKALVHQEENPSFGARAKHYGRWLLGWALGLAILLAMGAILSVATLRAAARIPTRATGHARGFEAALRRIYRGVLWITCAYYYASLPILLLVVVVAGGGIVYGLFAVGHIPIKLVFLVVVVVAVSVGAVFKSLMSVFERGGNEDPGEDLDVAKHPRLQGVLAEVASRIGTRPVDRVFLTPGTDMAVMERGGVLVQLRQKGERCLILGAGLLEGMRVRELKAVLAHEYGHFHNEDTAGGSFSLAVQRSLFNMAVSLAKGGAAGWYNPAWWFVLGFHKVFLRISHGASRLQEILADRWAVFAYGSSAFEGGLRHVIARSVRFEAHIGATLEEVISAKQPLANLYAFAPTKPTAEADLETAIAEALGRDADAYDSHPPPKDRFAWAHALGAKGDPPAPGDDDGCWSLFEDREAIEHRMTKEVRSIIRERHGVVIAAAEPS